MPKNMSEDELNDFARQYMRSTGEPVTPEEIASIAANFDEEAEIEAATQSYETKLWDKESPINGVPAKDVLKARDDIPEGGEVYLIIDKNSGDVVFFQPYLPNQEGLKKITQGNWESESSKHVKEVATQDASQKFMNDIPKSLKEIRNPKSNKA